MKKEKKKNWLGRLKPLKMEEKKFEKGDFQAKKIEKRNWGETFNCVDSIPCVFYSKNEKKTFKIMGRGRLTPKKN